MGDRMKESEIAVSTAPQMTTAEAERLSLIRYQLLSAAELLNSPPPINTLAINAIQDVVESTLGAVGEHVLAEVKARSEFDKLFDAVVGKLGSPPELAGLRPAAVALNNARVGFKHHGNQVRDETLRRHHDVAVTLVHGLVRGGFGVDLDDVSLLIFIPHNGVRGFIEKAEALHKANELIRAMSYLRAAFDLSVDDYANRKSVDGWYSIFRVGSGTTTPSGLGRVGWERPYTELHSWVEALDARIRLAAIGVDLSRYAYFDAVAPVATYLATDDRGPVTRVQFKGVTDDHYRASYLFAVDTALRLSAQDFNLRAVNHGFRAVEAYDPEFYSESYTARKRENQRLQTERQSRAASASASAGPLSASE
jgi:hypothetical protein